MSQAETLLNSLDEPALYTATPETEGHIVVGDDRIITVPPELKRIAVQYDHNVETVTFDCPRYWDGLDMSKMVIYINYKRADGKSGSYAATDVTIDDENPSTMHFNWTVSANVTAAKGPLIFMVCIKHADEDGNEINHWNSELCKDMHVSEGLQCVDISADLTPDIITQIFGKLGGLSFVKCTQEEYDAAETHNDTIVYYAIDDEGNVKHYLGDAELSGGSEPVEATVYALGETITATGFATVVEEEGV